MLGLLHRYSNLISHASKDRRTAYSLGVTLKEPFVKAALYRLLGQTNISKLQTLRGVLAVRAEVLPHTRQGGRRANRLSSKILAFAQSRHYKELQVKYNQLCRARSFI